MPSETSRKPLSRWQKATALVPLALLSGAWTASLTVTTPAAAELGANGGSGKLPDGTSVPQQAIKAPASVSNPGEIAPGVPVGSAKKVIAGASANGIPAAALSAYQRAAQVIDTADKSCHIDWTLIAAIGRIESNHGRYGGNTLNSNGVSVPGIYGIRLDGRNGTAKIPDTDGGQYDHDTKFDRAVGPMQFIPSTWSVVGVDGDGDGKRNPQDIDDAALATAVYLCSGNEDLSTTQGQRSAVYRYNHSNAYVNLVLAVARAYAQGDYSAVPTSTGGTTTFTPAYGDSVLADGTSGYHFPKGHGYGGSSHVGGSGSSSGGGSASSSGGTTSSSGGSTSTGSTGGVLPSAGPTSGASSGGSGSGGGGVTGTVKKIIKKVTNTPAPTSAPKPTAPPVVKNTLTKAEATKKCLAEGINPLDTAKLNACIDKLLNG
jgi:hypothetical protein